MFPLGKLYITRKVYLSNFQKSKHFGLVWCTVFKNCFLICKSENGGPSIFFFFFLVFGTLFFDFNLKNNLVFLVGPMPFFKTAMGCFGLFWNRFCFQFINVERCLYLQISSLTVSFPSRITLTLLLRLHYCYCSSFHFSSRFPWRPTSLLFFY